MLLSVIIPTYNEEKYIGGCLASLQKQRLEIGDQLEIIVIDDGSTDSTIEKIKHTPQAILLHQHHQGPALARNRAAKIAKGQILVFVDADMEFHPEFISHLVAPIKTGQTKGTFSKDEYVANWNQPLARCWNWNQNWPAKRLHPPNNLDTGSDFRAILATEFHRVGGFDNTGYTDTWTLPAKLGYRPIHVREAVFYHHNPDSFGEIFAHARWVSKRQYKLGQIGQLAGLVRASLPLSMVIGLYKAFRFREPGFLAFKIVYDLGYSLGILEQAIIGKKIK